jgi:hypothetical protein
MSKLGIADWKKDRFTIKKLEANILKELVDNFIRGLYDNKL